jgi:secreted trypsin-like serine protease
MTRLIFPLKLAGALALLLSSAAAAASAVERPGPAAREAVVGGVLAQSGAYASVADIIDLRGPVDGQCTGTVVAPSVILTAAHCAENIVTGVPYPPSGFRVLTGDVAGAGLQRQVSTVSAVIVYEGFRRRVDAGDAALLVLAQPTSAPAIRLATSADAGELATGATATIAGWGNTFYGQELPTAGLRSADTVVQAPHWCARNAPPFYDRSEICTIDPPSYATGACNGDSGGPLLGPLDTGEEPLQIGIAVHVYGRCSTRRPSVFTRVDAIASWVRSWINAYSQPAPASAPAPPGTPPAGTPAAPGTTPGA